MLQSHIHFGQPSVNGGIAAFLCTNLGNGPAGTPVCPQPAPGKSATVEGTIRAMNVVGPTAQGIEPGQFAELVNAIRGGVTYVNLHSTRWPNGEIRGLLRDDEHEHEGTTSSAGAVVPCLSAREQPLAPGLWAAPRPERAVAQPG